MGGSSSKNKSEQKAKVGITQQFAGTCDVTCQNSLSNVTVDIIDSTIGGSVVLDQTCSTNANCLIGSTMNATADVVYKATNTSNAKNSFSGWSLDPFNFDTASNTSRQNIKEKIEQNSTEKCNVSSYNQMNDVTIFAANSTIGGNLEIDQSGSTQGKCQLENTMSAAAYATGTAQNLATSGKDKKGQKFGDKSGKFQIITYVIIAVVVCVIAVVIGKMVSGGSTKRATRKEMKEVAMARAEAGCPGGVQPILNQKTGRPIIDPKTGGPICPPPPVRSTPRSAPDFRPENLSAPQRPSSMKPLTARPYMSST